MRAVTEIAKLALQFDCKITLAGGAHPETSHDARSVIDLACLGAQCGDAVTISADGPDEEEAMGALLDLFARRFDEE